MLSRRRRLRGLTRMLSALKPYLAPYRGTIRLADGTRHYIDPAAQIIDFWLLFTGHFEPPITWILRGQVYAGAYCMDVGANVGAYAMRMATWCGPNGRVAAFEPNPGAALHLERSIQANKFTHFDLVGAPVSDTEQEVTFYLSAKSVQSSLHLEQAGQVVDELHLRTTTIDHYIEQNQWSRLDVMKIDTEGSDCECILGAAQSIRRFKPFIIFEYHAQSRSEKTDQAFALLVENNYDIQLLNFVGRLEPLDWRILTDGYTDVACFPRS